MPKSYQANELTGIIKINEGNCKGCDTCKSFCPADAITGKPGKEVYKIDAEKCIKCGLCITNCKFGAVERH